MGQVSYHIWRLPDTDTNRNRQDLKKELDKLQDMGNRQQELITTSTVDEQGRVQVKLGEGLYYVRAYRKDVLAPDIVSFLLEISMIEETIIHPKWQTIRGRLKVLKYEMKSGQRIPLKGVTFSIYQLGDLQFTRVKDGEFTTDSNGSTILTTDDKGEILVSGLLPEDYRLREQTPLDGFEGLKEDISFSITGEDVVVKEIENHRLPPETPPSSQPPTPKPQPKPKPPSSKPKLPSFLPSTGTEVVAWLSMLGGAIGFIALTIRKNPKKQTPKIDGLVYCS